MPGGLSRCRRCRIARIRSSGDFRPPLALRMAPSMAALGGGFTIYNDIEQIEQNKAAALP